MKSRIWMFAVSLCCSLAFTSCIKDELPNNECDIVSAWVEGDEFADNFYQVSQMRHDNISSTEQEIEFTVRSLISLPNRIPVYFTITPGATITPASGSEQDFTNGPVTYTVTSEDGDWTRQYKVSFKEASLPSFKFSFENVEVVEASNKNSYHTFFELDTLGNRLNVWASGNAGVALMSYGSKPEDYPTRSSADGYVGKCLCLATQSAGSLGQMMGKPIAAGTLFLGRFVLENVLLQPLKATEFGIPFGRLPMRVTGYYKYRPGDEFTNANMEVQPGRVDEASIYAVIYRNHDENDNELKLYGDDVQTSPYIVRKAQVASLPATDQWTRFEMFLEGEDIDDAVLDAQGYSMTLVFSSSKAGDTFEGAIGSILYVDEVELLFEEDVNK